MTEITLLCQCLLVDQRRQPKLLTKMCGKRLASVAFGTRILGEES